LMSRSSNPGISMQVGWLRGPRRWRQCHACCDCCQRNLVFIYRPFLGLVVTLSQAVDADERMGRRFPSQTANYFALAFGVVQFSGHGRTLSL
jgi:hypothetical protein